MLYEAIVAGDAPKALELQRRLIPPTARFVGAMGISGVKYAMDLRGYYGGPVRGPLLPLDEGQKREIETMIAGLVSSMATV